MKIINVLLMSCLLAVTVSPASLLCAHSKSITAEELILQDKKNHVEDFACSCIDPRCH